MLILIKIWFLVSLVILKKIRILKKKYLNEYGILNLSMLDHPRFVDCQNRSLCKTLYNKTLGLSINVLGGPLLTISNRDKETSSFAYGQVFEQEYRQEVYF